MQYKIKDYIGESHQDVFDSILLSNDNNLIVAPTESGKTSSVKTFAKNYPDKRVALLCPMRSAHNMVALWNPTYKYFIKMTSNGLSLSPKKEDGILPSNWDAERFRLIEI